MQWGMSVRFSLFMSRQQFPQGETFQEFSHPASQWFFSLAEAGGGQEVHMAGLQRK